MRNTLDLTPRGAVGHVRGRPEAVCAPAGASAGILRHTLRNGRRHELHFIQFSRRSQTRAPSGVKPQGEANDDAPHPAPALVIEGDFTDKVWALGTRLFKPDPLLGNDS
ncbi:MAG: hypothetical protein V3T84_13875 [Phycisphaerales bacterium]